MKDSTKGNLALLLTAIIWGSGFIAQKLGMNTVPPLAFNSGRQVLAALVLLPVLLINLRRNHYLDKAVLGEDKFRLRVRRMLLAGLVCGIFMTFGSMMQQLGLVTVSAGKSGFISTLYIVMVPILGSLLGSKIHIKSIVCVAIAVLGFSFLSLSEGFGSASIGDWLSLLGALGFALQIIAVNHFVDQDNDILISVLQMAFCGIVGMTISIFVEHPSIAQFSAGLPVILYSVIFPTAIGYTLQITGQKYTDPTTASLLMSLESVFAAIFGAIFLRETMTQHELLGCALIFLAIILDQAPLPSIRRN